MRTCFSDVIEFRPFCDFPGRYLKKEKWDVPISLFLHFFHVPINILHLNGSDGFLLTAIKSLPRTLKIHLENQILEEIMSISKNSSGQRILLLVTVKWHRLK
jgi:hypothetical protein